MKKIKKLSLSVFSNYLLTYVGIAVFFCALLGIFLFNFFVAGYGKSILESEQKKAAMVVNDLENQMDIMSQISYSVSNEMAYPYEKLKENNYNEFIMLKEFLRYSNAGMFSEHYFLLYREEPRVYSVKYRMAAVYDYALYAGEVLKIGEEEAAALYESLTSMPRQTILSLGEEMRLFCYPLQINSRFISANLCFCVPLDELRERAQIVSGGLGNGTVYYKDWVLYDWQDAEVETTGEEYQLLSNGGRFSITLRIDTSRYMSNLLSYRRMALFALLICAGILAVSLAAAHIHTKPIKRIKEQLDQEGHDTTYSVNELSDISRKLNDIIVGDQQQKALFQAQMYYLRAQALHLLLCGEYNDTIKQLLDQMNIEVENGHVGVIVIRIEEDMTEDEKKELMARIEDLSMEELQLYCAIDQKNGDIDVIQHLSVLNEANQNEALDMIRELMDSQELDNLIGNGWLYRDPHKLAASYAEACDNLLAHDEGQFHIPTDDTHRYFSRMIGAIRLGETDEAKRIFGLFEAEFEQLLRSMMVQRYILTELLNILVTTANEMQIPLPHHQLSVVLTAQNCRIACDGIRDILDYIGDHVKMHENNNSSEKKLIHSVVDYVRKHYTENDLSLDRLAEEFHVSAGYLSRLFRTSLGVKYKDYVLQLKMDYARQCLRQGMSVTQTGKECGYANISHFIKAFKMFVGATPSAYQKGGVPENPENMPRLVEYLEDEDE